MRTWEIAKALVGNCTSPEDVDQVIQILNNAVAIQDVCSILASFSNSPSSTSPQQVGTKKERESNSFSSRAEPRSMGQRGAGKGVDGSFEVAQAYQLEALLRASGKTNKQIEEWMSENFNVQAVVGKGSLRLYLSRVLRKADLSLRNRMLASAQNLVRKDISGTADIRAYWDELEKRYLASDLND